MYRLFCCKSRRSSRVEVDEVTDSLERCLTVERGVREFKLFLERNRFDDKNKTLSFVLRCRQISTEIARLSPYERANSLPVRIQNDLKNLYDMADDINFDMNQMESLSNLFSSNIKEKMYALQMAEIWGLDLLQDIYKVFRRETIEKV